MLSTILPHSILLAALLLSMAASWPDSLSSVSSRPRQNSSAGRWLYLVSFSTLFCGLTARTDPSNKGYFIALTGLCGFATAATEVIPVAGIGLVVPHYLIGTSNMVLGTFRALGGALGIAIFTSVYNNKVATFIPDQVTPILVQAGVPAAAYGDIFTTLFTAPAYIMKVPGLTVEMVQSVLAATAVGASQGYAFLWYGVATLAAVCLILAFFYPGCTTQDDRGHRVRARTRDRHEGEEDDRGLGFKLFVFCDTHE